LDEGGKGNVYKKIGNFKFRNLVFHFGEAVKERIKWKKLSVFFPTLLLPTFVAFPVDLLVSVTGRVVLSVGKTVVERIIGLIIRRRPIIGLGRVWTCMIRTFAG
jgi:hypothetical protein